MRHFLQDPSRDVEEPYFTVSEFFDWLFSKENQLLDTSSSTRVTQDMTRPLSHYWISSSHNTPLFCNLLGGKCHLCRVEEEGLVPVRPANQHPVLPLPS